MIISDMTRALIKGLPRLFAKHQTDSNRVADVLTIPQLMNVDLYLEMRVIPVSVLHLSIHSCSRSLLSHVIGV
jgi:hypothetical protein